MKKNLLKTLLLTTVSLATAHSAMAENVIINNAEDLAAFAARVNAGEVTLDATLNADITATAYTVIGTAANQYAGTFDGDGHTITLSLEGWDTTGAFGKVNGATIKNLTIAGTIAAAFDNGCIVAVAAGGDILIENCVNKASMTATNNGEKHAGIVGRANGCTSLTIKDCVNEGTITGGNYAAGILGLADVNSPITITGCVNKGTITGKQKCAGIQGEQYNGSTTITNCVNEGTLNAVKNSGGILGGANTTTTITDCWNKADITSSGDDAGGILGAAYGECVFTIERCINEGNVRANGEAGGLLGANWNVNATFNMTDCGSCGTITSGWVSGSIAGYCSDLGTFNITNCAGFTNSNTIGSPGNSVKNVTNLLNPGWGNCATTVDAETVTSGEMAYTLDGGRGVWGQIIGTDEHPVFVNAEKTNIVYLLEDGTYSNDNPTTAIKSILKFTDNNTYNLRGQRVDGAVKGLFIQNGKKYFIK